MRGDTPDASTVSRYACQLACPMTGIANAKPTIAVAIGLGLSFLIPVIAPTPPPRNEEERTIELLESLEMMEPIEPARDVVRGRGPGPAQ